MSIKTRTSGIMIDINVEPSGAAYQGPGDVVSGAYAWWGLRAYTLASIGQNAVILHYNDATEITYATIAGGGLDTTTIAADTITHGAPVEVLQLFDQTGNARHLIPGAALRPSFSITGNGLSVPNMGFLVASNQRLRNTAFGTQAQPLTYNVVANHTTSAAQQNCLVTVIGGNSIACGQYRTSGNNIVSAGYAGSVSADVSLNDGTWAAVQATFTNTAGDITAVNAAQATGVNLGANTLDTTVEISHTSLPFDGFVAEAGIWAVAFTGTQLTNMYNNQKAYYGLP